MFHRKIVCVCVAAAALLVWAVSAQSVDPLQRGFQDPPDSAKPRVWWHWMNGNITKEGHQGRPRMDEARRASAASRTSTPALNTPQIVEKRLVYMTPEWKDAFKYAATLADQLGLEMAIAGSPGWSESGGPWVTPAQAMKKYVWSETRVWKAASRSPASLPQAAVHDRAVPERRRGRRLAAAAPSSSTPTPP